MKQQEVKLLKEALDYYESKKFDDSISTAELSDVEWSEFRFDEVFNEIKRGKRLTKVEQIKGDTPYISSTGLNNGVDNFIGNTKGVRKYEDCLTVANSGSVGSCFYHKYEFIASDHVTHLKNDNFDKYIYLFIAPIIQRLEEKYSFNREISDKRLKKEKLLLPIDKKGEINFRFMRDFMKKIEVEELNKIINLYKDRINNI